MSMKQTMCEFVHGMTCKEVCEFVGSIMRCSGCEHVSFDEFGIGWCDENCREVKPWDFCAWGERQTINKTDDSVIDDRFCSLFDRYIIDGIRAWRERRSREEIVRCRDCKHGHETDWPADFGIPEDYLDCTGPLVTTWDDWRDKPKDNPVPPDGFCFGGERRSE